MANIVEIKPTFSYSPHSNTNAVGPFGERVNQRNENDVWYFQTYFSHPQTCVEFFFLTGDNPTEKSIHDIQIAAGVNLKITVEATTLRFYLRNTLLGQTTIEKERWYHLSANNTHTLTIYLDGESVLDVAHEITIPTSPYYNQGGWGSSGWNGNLIAYRTWVGYTRTGGFNISSIDYKIQVELKLHLLSTVVGHTKKVAILPPNGKLRMTLLSPTVTNDLIRGGVIIGGVEEITGTVKKKLADGTTEIFTDPVVLLATPNGRWHRETIVRPDGTFTIKSLRKQPNQHSRYTIMVVDHKTGLHKTFIRVDAGDHLDVVLESEEKPQQPNYQYKVSGRVTDHEGNPIQRKVGVYSRTTNELLGNATSGADGNYSIKLTTDQTVYVVCLPENDEDVNAKIWDRVRPVPI